MRRLALTFAWLLMQGCMSSQFSILQPGHHAFGSFTVQAADAAWNRAPQQLTPHLYEGSQLWTRDGPLLDSLTLLPGIPDGGYLFVSPSKSPIYPAYRAGMLPNEIAELLESSLARLNGPEVLVSSSGLRPYPVAGMQGLLVDLQLTGADGPSRRGRAMAFVQNRELYVLLYLAAWPHYAEKHLDAAMTVMNSVRPDG